jgi:TfoX/Sxy family transcriptional regulator of competence genes
MRRMAYDEALAERVRAIIGVRSGVTERKMFGGIAWMLGGNMACGVLREDLLIRLDYDDADRALAEPNTSVFDMTGRPARGMVVVAGDSVAEDAALARWVDAGADHAASLPPK